ncbi:DUF4232 domain-containing protein [Kitasatospora sp. NPDC096077]|uniref:DUF4232 domain-containing protein n=1 Tax=Kitasatospora sp. NPDC096077 TaxID=3155544 RepID=UPI00333245A5
MSVRHRRPLLATAVLVAGAGLALTACGPDNSDPVAGATASATGAASAAPAATGAPAGSHPTTHAPKPSGTGRPGGNGGATGGTGASGGPCDIQNLSIHMTPRSGAPTQFVIDVKNTGGSACTLSATPGVNLGNSTAQDQSKNLKPILASGTERFTVAAGKNAYVAIDVNPSGATTGTVPGINEVNVLADDDDTNMPLANTQNFPLPAGAKVLDPKMGVYRASVAEAVASMASAPK